MPRQLSKVMKTASFLVAVGLLCLVSLLGGGGDSDGGGEKNDLEQQLADDYPGATGSIGLEEEDTLDSRAERLRRECRRLSDPFRPESASLVDERHTFGSEVVHLRSEAGAGARAAVCVPHKVGSHSWGRFARELQERQTARIGEAEWRAREAAFAAMNFTERAKGTLKVTVVRHPLSRLLSVYRMIFERWCDRDRFLAHQWDNVCKLDFIEADREEEERERKSSSLLENEEEEGMSLSELTAFFTKAFRHHQEGNDRFLLHLWRRFHPRPEALTDPQAQLRLSFSEFADFLVNTSASSWSTDLNPSGLSYHWAPFWRECPLCSSVAGPDLVIRMETFRSDLEEVLRRLGLDGIGGEGEGVPEFPHTHKQQGGHSSEMRLAQK